MPSITSRCLPVLYTVLAIATTSCAGRLDDLDSTRSGLGPGDCIPNRGIRDFDTLDNRSLILYGPGRRAYHVILTTPAMDLEREIAIGVYDTDGRICPGSGDAIIVNGPIPERVPIRSIEALDDLALESLLVEYGKLDAAEITITSSDSESE